MRYHRIPISIAENRNIKNKIWQRCGEKRNTVQWWWEWKLMQQRRKTMWRFPQKTKNRLTISSVQLLSRVWLSVIPWIAARHVSQPITNARSSLRLTSIESVMPSSHLILCCPLLLLPSIPPKTLFSPTDTKKYKKRPWWLFPSSKMTDYSCS